MKGATLILRREATTYTGRTSNPDWPAPMRMWRAYDASTGELVAQHIGRDECRRKAEDAQEAR